MSLCMAAPSPHLNRSTQNSNMLEKPRSRCIFLRSTSDRYASISGNDSRSIGTNRSSRESNSSSPHPETEGKLSTKICRHIFVDNSTEPMPSLESISSMRRRLNFCSNQRIDVVTPCFATEESRLEQAIGFYSLYTYDLPLDFVPGTR